MFSKDAMLPKTFHKRASVMQESRITKVQRAHYLQVFTKWRPKQPFSENMNCF